jgi:hypothetical protein
MAMHMPIRDSSVLLPVAVSFVDMSGKRTPLAAGDGLWGITKWSKM